MGDYDLRGLSTLSFENLIQALAVKFLGAGTVVFGDGPDGGREATFEGRMDYPSQADPWDGYCVIQAKFRQRPEGTGKDGDWALAELDKELKGFTDRKKGRRHPVYYIFATNVVLSPVQDKGAKDKAAALFRKYKKKTPLRDWRVWDFDQLGTFLDDAADIRRAYAAWVTPGDVLAEVLEGLQPKRPDFLEVMTSFLARDLLRDQYANLEQAGHAAEDKIPLARVFVDLPITGERTAEPPEEDRGGKARVGELVASLVYYARNVLVGTRPPPSLQSRSAHTPSLDNDEAANLRDDHRHPREDLGGSVKGTIQQFWIDIIQQAPEPGRYVLIGGPGQGKTTVGQFVCQLFRAALLRDCRPQLHPAEVREALDDVETHCEPGRLELPRARRFPVRIVLSQLAMALSKEPELAVLEYVAKLIAGRTSREVSTEDLRTWLGAYPWLLVLDGLDEVPASTNRDQVLRKVEELWIDAAQCNADLLVLATTRPQGYNDDFSPRRYRHLWLAPLSVERALAYARRLVEVRYAGDGERQKKILDRLAQASTGDATARLMRSPLQVTILAMLVDHIGPPPQDRWQLFSDYYEVIYRRERERDIPAADVLRDHRSNIDAIHYQVGLLLQLEAERAGGTDASLPAERFEKIVAARLENVGYEGQELGELRQAIIEAAAHRLVFLVGLEADKVGFEIRSLQEFLAAQALMSGKDEDVQKRLRRIAPISSWRNAFLFAAGRYFCKPDKEHFQETIFTLCKALNDEEAGKVAQAVLAGSQLALELLEDGVARRKPKYARLLAECACGLLEQPAADIHGRLAVLADGATEKVLLEHLEQWLSRDVPASLGAWASLFPLVGQRQPQARKLADRFWPTEPPKQLRPMQVATAVSAGEWWVEPLEKAIRKNHPHEVDRRGAFVRRLAKAIIDQRTAKIAPGETELLGWFSSRFLSTTRSMSIPVTELGIDVVIVPLKAARQLLTGRGAAFAASHPGWLPLIEGQRFAMNPSASTLARVLEKVADSPASFPLSALTGMLPWVLGACLGAARNPADAAALAARAAAGDLGDVEVWRAAENRWRNQGVRVDDLRYMRDDKWPFDQSIADHGLVLSGASIIRSDKPSSLEEYMRSVEPLKDACYLQEQLALTVLQQLVESRPPSWLSSDAFLRLYERAGKRLGQQIWGRVAQWAQDDAAWLTALDTMGRTTVGIGWSPIGIIAVEFYASLFHEHPDQPGLLPMVAAALFNTPDTKAVELPAVRFEAFSESPVRGAAVLLELARGGLTGARAAELASVTVELAKTNGLLLWEAIRILDDLEHFDDSSRDYLLKLRTRLPTDDWRGTRAVLGALENCFRRGSSGLTDRDVWRSLALPEGLLGVIE